MKAGLLALLLVVAGTGTALADSCVTNTYDNYVGNSCTITTNPPGDVKTFSNFSYSTSGTNPMPDNQITVTPSGQPYTAALLFNAPWSAAASQTQDSLIGFTVTLAQNNTALINSLTLLMFGAAFNGTGSVSVAETYCLGDTFSDGCAHGTTGTLSTFLNGSGSKLIATVSFAGVREVDVMKDIQLTGGGDGFSVISGVENQIGEDTPVTEPSALSVLGGSLLIMGGLVRRKLSV